MTTTISRRRGLKALALVTAVTLIGPIDAAHAQGFSNKPIRLIVGYSPGGAVDIIARRIGNSTALILTRSRGRSGPERQEAP